MCLRCDTDEDLADCAYEGDEHHPEQWTKEQLTDSNERRYNPYQGSYTPTEGRCNATLDNWEDRYGEVRYCMRLPENCFVADGSEFCRVHKKREQLMKRASDIFVHGVYSKTIRHVFEKLGPMQKLTALGWYDSYMQESSFDFDTTLEGHIIDFADYDGDLPVEIEAELTEKGEMEVGVPIPQSHEVRAFALYRAALADIKVGLADREILDTSDDTTAMERETVVGVTDEGREITDLDEHHLNVPVSRADGDKKELLAFGGVPIDGDVDDLESSTSPDQLILNLEDTAQTDGEINPVEEEMLSTSEGDVEESLDLSNDDDD